MKLTIVRSTEDETANELVVILDVTFWVLNWYWSHNRLDGSYLSLCVWFSGHVENVIIIRSSSMLGELTVVITSYEIILISMRRSCHMYSTEVKESFVV